MVMRAEYQIRGVYVNVNIFVGTNEKSLSKAGRLIFRTEEFAMFKDNHKAIEWVEMPLEDVKT